MKVIKTLLVVSALMLCVAGFAQKKSANKKATPAATQKTMNTQMDSVSYALGMSLGQNFKDSQLDKIDLNTLTQAIKDVLEGKPTRFDAMAADAIIRNYFESRQAEAASENKAAGQKFLAENKTKPGVITLPDGLQYRVIVEGKGPKPTAADVVKVHYKGMLIDGREFDSSYKRGEPIEFSLGSVIKGWTEGLQQVNEGSTVVLYIPSELAYGDREMQGSIITPGSTLVFEVELLEVKK